MHFAKRIWSNKFYQGGIFLTIASFGVNLMNYFFNLLVGRTLGPIGYSEIIALFSYIAILSVPISVFSTLIIQKTGSKDEKKLHFAKELEQWLIAKIKERWYLIIPIVLVMPLIPYFTNLTPKTAFALIPLVALSLMASFYSSSLQGLHFFLAISLITLVTACIKLLGPIFNLFFPSLFVILFFLLLASFFNFLFSKKVFSDALKPVKNHRKKIERSLLSFIHDRKLLVSTLSILAITLFSNIDIIFAKRFFSAYDAGIYGAWNLMAKVISYFFFPILAISFVYFSSKKNHDKQKNIFFVSLLIFAIVGVISYFFYTYFGEFVINLFFGSRFATVTPYLSYASIFGILYSVIVYINDFFIAKESKFSAILPCAIAIYIASLLIIPKDIGSFISLNTFFAACLTIVYLIASTYSLLYNRAHEKKD